MRMHISQGKLLCEPAQTKPGGKNVNREQTQGSTPSVRTPHCGQERLGKKLKRFNLPTYSRIGSTNLTNFYLFWGQHDFISPFFLATPWLQLGVQTSTLRFTASNITLFFHQMAKNALVSPLGIPWYSQQLVLDPVGWLLPLISNKPSSWLDLFIAMNCNCLWTNRLQPCFFLDMFLVVIHPVRIRCRNSGNSVASTLSRRLTGPCS